MGDQVKKVCFFSALFWTKTLAWIHIVFGILGAVGCGIVLVIGYSRSHPPEEQEEFKNKVRRVIGVLIYMIVSLVLSILHLHATKKEKTKSLWCWVVMQSLAILSFIVNLIVGSRMKNPDLTEEGVSWTGILKAGLEFFTILVVLQRIRDIRASRRGESKVSTAVSEGIVMDSEGA